MQGFYRRRHMTALPLLKSDGIGALIIENPYYGSRKPKGQTLSQVLHVSDLFVMGLSLMLECLVLRKWLEGEGWGPVGVTGISMGGHVRREGGRRGRWGEGGGEGEGGGGRGR